MANALANAICERCRGGFAPAEKIVNSNGELYHEQCFVCAQCFQQFPEGLFYEEVHSHPSSVVLCFEYRASSRLGPSGVETTAIHLCRPCHNREKARGLGKYICQKCHAIIDEQPLIFKNDPYHPDHFNCANCGGKLLKALLFGDVCFHCNRVIEGDVVSALNKAWCVNCFACSTCNTKLTLKDKFVEIDLKPVCKHCYEKMPDEFKRRLAKREREAKDKEKQKKKKPICL
ncbi:lim and senescent cell antigen-like-containing domain protein 1 isoform x5 [Limosa lapponica baueri]|uniref:Lim and senescent cell antigen-like-containing domain protein 1 isoform x5 n=1 Tax=Limosa lapponica baueri TaxID=1758121 RepID=A0A2I0UBM9_LIMLA|nr:lim and senescent cell antigen-like-containing domain protein 1 isoform x5 [Limosa lapponica baueri]